MKTHVENKMHSEKSLLSLIVWIVLVVCISKTTLNTCKELQGQGNTDGATVLAVLLIPQDNDGRMNTLYIKDTTFQVALRSLVKSVLYVLAAEILRSLVCYMMFESRSVHITMTYDGSRDQGFNSFYWNMVINNSVDRVSYSYVYDPEEVYEIRSKRALYVTIVTYDAKTGEYQTSIRPRVFGWC